MCFTHNFWVFFVWTSTVFPCGLLLQDDFAEVSEINVDRKKSKSLKGLANGHLNGENGKSIAEKSCIRNYDHGSKKSKGSSLDVARKGKVA